MDCKAAGRNVSEPLSVNYPAFFAEIPPITLFDPLADFFGAPAQGIVEFHFIDVVRQAGHCCPTIAGSWLMAREGLKALYGSEMPQRGNIAVAMQKPVTEGVTGVMANLFTLVTGATELSGFHGLAGQFDRRGLLSFSNPISGTVRFTRKDTLKHVTVAFDASAIPVNPAIGNLMPLMLAGEATPQQKKGFQQHWQERVRMILLHNDPQRPLVTLTSQGFHV